LLIGLFSRTDLQTICHTVQNLSSFFRNPLRDNDLRQKKSAREKLPQAVAGQRVAWFSRRWSNFAKIGLRDAWHTTQMCKK